ncbi:MFS transporter [Bacillus massiliglaciei]|uniref:MFS transporter n=1 Tax=Bacillus massiliglaciei TaxID=1816693 RepID=UPI000AA8CD8F|nr:MFS transporter [Bacillus massiliglaciei]
MNQKWLIGILVCLVGISGFSQGMLLPVIAVIFEHDGISSSLNGLHATSIYLGVLIASPLMEAPLRKFGYKPMILIGGLTVIIALALFPIGKSFWFWFVLRLLIGIGDHMLHFSTQTWITAATPLSKRGRNIAIYGLFFSMGFMAGPLMTKLLEVNEALPFFMTSALSLIMWMTILFLKNERPAAELDAPKDSLSQTLKRFKRASRYAWAAFLPPFAYGVLEASLNSNFPVLALRSGLELTAVSIILPAFSFGTLFTQIPLGMLSDKYGRRNILLFVLTAGMLIFTGAGFLHSSSIGLFICFLLAGAMVGSTFSLGISYMADLLPDSLLPSGNLLCGIFFSLGSIIGPFLGGLAIQYLNGGSMFFMIGILLLLIIFALLSFKEKKLQASL